ncbi:MAG: peptidoglycan-binding protein [Rhodobacteraceae bacterium]|nr:peptidoglycan-binding protein [Paracoccaceae bacterium]
MRKIAMMTAALGVLALALPAQAKDVALVIGNSDYRGGPDVRDADDLKRSAEALTAGGFEVISAIDAESPDIQVALTRFLAEAEDADSITVILAGRFAHTSRESWLLPTDARQTSLANLGGALPVSALLSVLETRPGRALLILGDEDRDREIAPFLSEGAGEIPAPQGVMILTGTARSVAAFGEDTFERPDRPLVPEATRYGLEVSGYAPLDWTLEAGGGGAPAPRESADERGWREAQERDTLEAYQDYLRRFPDGPNAEAAQARIAELTPDPAAEAQATEEALGLNREERREIQRDLSLLDYNTRGIDGIFGRGTRTAIANWQQANRFDATGYLTREQVTTLDAQAGRRAAELEREAEARRAEEERADRVYWDETGARGDEDGLRAYLERYPDGLYADVAEARLAEHEEERRREASFQERDMWDWARNQDTVRAYREYLDRYPGGVFAEDARDRIRELSDDDRSEEIRQAEAAEAALNLSTTTRRIIENQLDRQGYEPGPVDGEFDDQTRRAIRRYQRSQGFEVTGYLNEGLVVRLLAESIFR